MDTLTPIVTPTPEPHGPFAALRRVFPTGEVIRFLLVGASNTLFSYALYAACVRFYGHLMPTHGQPLIADIASITSKPIGITVAFLGYKHFVFRTHGNYLKEWLRCFAVYGVSTPVELVILPVATKLFLLTALTHPYAPYLAGIVNSVVIASYSYFAHKKFSFRR
ncbi:GtrA family protein [Granulicella tundricola]|uniref:GtrA family protein n=1 Tax=Granulicella tundricola (strain ATCC BAA-1859 / DSM 23138 / MP5ACTX9) TaxID=1198114 RepID=E8X391_GRATM|nr:GtrA family protein [Granulicella tundricola]ADW69315.1 GtrA family protein [Granulicella tundricola MP5ACTX9]